MKSTKWDGGFKAHGCLVLLLLALTLTACKPKSYEPASDAAQPPSFSVTPPIPAGANDLFEDVTAKARIDFVQQFCDDRIANILESNGSGVVVFDYDNDGYMDLYFVNPGPMKGVTHEAPGTRRQPNRLYHNNGDGTFTDVTEKAGVGGQGFGIAAAAADYDGDGWTDLYVVNAGKNILYHNNGDGTFTDVTDKAGVGDPGTGIGATWLDVNNDGRLDLYVANYLSFDPDYKLFYNPTSYPGPLAYKPERDVLYINNGDGTFTNASESAGIWALPPHRTMSVHALDYNRDGHEDLYICNDATPNMLLINDGHGHFHDEAMQRGVAFNALGEAAGSMTAAIGDCDGDQIQDILVSRLGYGSLYMGTEKGDYLDRMMASGLGVLTAQYVGWGCNFIDFDNAGKLDVFIANGDRLPDGGLAKPAAGERWPRQFPQCGGQGRRLFPNAGPGAPERHAGLRQRRPDGLAGGPDGGSAGPASQPRPLRQPLDHPGAPRNQEQPGRLGIVHRGDGGREEPTSRKAVAPRAS